MTFRFPPFTDSASVPASTPEYCGPITHSVLEDTTFIELAEIDSNGAKQIEITIDGAEAGLNIGLNLVPLRMVILNIPASTLDV